MLTVALTGGIASGKSLVAGVFRAGGAHVDSADAAARELMAPGRPAWEAVVARLGPEVLAPEDGTIDRETLAAALFRDAGLRAWLNGIVHPLVQEERRKTVARLEEEGRTRIYVAESALIFEAGAAGFFDRVVVAACAEDVQVGRLAVRDGLDPAEALRRVRSQMPNDEKKRRADYVVETGGSASATLAGAARVFARLLEDAAGKEGGETLRPLNPR